MFPYSDYYDYIETIIRDIAHLALGDKYGDFRRLGINYAYTAIIKPRIRLRNKDPT